MPMPNTFCLICNISIDALSSVNIFSTPFPCHGELLVNFISRILRVATSELQDSYVCLQCYNLFQMLEQAQKTVMNIRCEILKIYRATERRKSYKRSINNSTKLGLSTNNDENLKEPTTLQVSRIKETIVQQQCVHDNVTNQNVNNLKVNYSAINNKINVETKKHCRQKTIEHDEVNDIKPFNFNNTCDNNTKKDEIFKNEMLHDSVVFTSDNINTSQEGNAYALKMHVGEQNFISLINSEEKGRSNNSSMFSDFKWEIGENVTEVKENSKNPTADSFCSEDQLEIPLKSGKISKYDLKSLKYNCPTCNKRWRTSAELKTHVKTHSTLRPYMCEKCGQAYKHKHALEIHIGMHNGINPFQCSFCNKCFTQKGALMRHLPIHTGEMPYQCELCGKRFIHHTSYNMHRLSHSGKKSYKCHMCDLSLLSTSHLKRHMRVHTGEKPYSCTICGKRFAERYNLLAHQKIHDPFESKTRKTKETQCQKRSLNDRAKPYFDTNTEFDLKKVQCTVLRVEPEVCDLPKKVDFEQSVLQETWIQMNHSKLDLIDNQSRLLLLQNSLSEIDENSFAVTFNNQKVALTGTNYNTNLQVIIESSGTSLVSNNLSSIDKIHM